MPLQWRLTTKALKKVGKGGRHLKGLSGRELLVLEALWYEDIAEYQFLKDYAGLSQEDTGTVLERLRKKGLVCEGEKD